MTHKALIWAGVALVMTLPLALALGSPLLAWREPVYIIAGFAGVFALALLFVQPLLAAGLLPWVSVAAGRKVHRIVGAGLVGAVAVHVAGLWVTSPPDVIDALLFVSPTPFSAWGVMAMWAVFATAVLALWRRRLRLRWRSWRIGHSLLAAIIVVGSVVHALLIDGTMEIISKAVLCVLVVVVASFVLSDRAVLARLLRRS